MPAVTLRLHQPAALGRRSRETGVIDTHRHIPGSVLRGALAAVWLQENGRPQAATPEKRSEFLHLFEGPVRYGPLFHPASDVVPLSVLACKYRPLDACRGFYLDQAVSHTGDDTPPTCHFCGGRTQPGRGEVEFFGVDAGLSQQTRVALDDSERAREGQLFSRRALRHRVNGVPREFSGRIQGGDSDRVEWLFTEHRLRIGARRSTSGGASYHPSTTPDSAPDATKLIRDDTLIVRLTSPALLVDAAGCPTQLPDGRLLSELLGADVTVEHTWTRREQVTGWHELTNLPKPTELAVSAGSVFRLRFDGSPPTAEGLARLHAHGLGLRRAEGFGWVELGEWTPPPVATARPRSETESQGTTVARRLLATVGGDAAWYLDQLREYLHASRLNRTPDAGFLTSSRAEVLDRNPEQPLSDQIRELLVSEEELEKAVQVLDSHVRKGRAE